MIMIPLPFVVALLLGGLALYATNERDGTNWPLTTFFGLYALQAVMVGLRFGYGMEWVTLYQPVTAAVLPALAWLSFTETSAKRTATLLALCVLAAVMAMYLGTGAIDALLAILGLSFSLLLMRIALTGSDALSWSPVRALGRNMALLWLVITVLVFASLADAAISLDYWANQGANTGSIVGAATLLGLLLLAISIWFMTRKGPAKPVTVSGQEAGLDETFSRIEKLMQEKKLYLDPDLNLNRIARRLSLPARDVSRAINHVAGKNVSQYVNMLRIREACQLLGDPDVQVTSVIYASGFSTKSNFNREFLRETGQSPKAWRDAGQ